MGLSLGNEFESLVCPPTLLLSQWFEIGQSVRHRWLILAVGLRRNHLPIWLSRRRVNQALCPYLFIAQKVGLGTTMIHPIATPHRLGELCALTHLFCHVSFYISASRRSPCHPLALTIVFVIVRNSRLNEVAARSIALTLSIKTLDALLGSLSDLILRRWPDHMVLPSLNNLLHWLEHILRRSIGCRLNICRNLTLDGPIVLLAAHPGAVSRRWFSIRAVAFIILRHMVRNLCEGSYLHGFLFVSFKVCIVLEQPFPLFFV